MNKNLAYWKQRFLIVRDFLCVMAASMLTNLVLQFLLYPAIERQVGVERYGEILVFITIANVCGLAYGGAASGTYLTSRRHYKAEPGDFFCILMVICAVTSAIAIIAVRQYLTGVLEGLCLALLIFLTVLKHYSLVDFQLKKDYAHYLLFVIIIAVVEIICLLLFVFVKWWPVLLLPGTVAGLAYVVLRGTIYRNVTQRSENFGRAAQDTVTLSGAYLLNYGTQQADRILLLPLLGGTAVTYYYVASLFSKLLSMITGPINNLILAYLADVKTPLNRKRFLLINGLIAVATVVFLGGVVLLGPWVLSFPFLYPDLVDAVRVYLPLASLGQLLVIGSSILITIDLLVAPKKMQLFLQGAYMIVYIALTIPFSMHSGLDGFVMASLLAGIVRYITAFGVGWKYIPAARENTR